MKRHLTFTFVYCIQLRHHMKWFNLKQRETLIDKFWFEIQPKYIQTVKLNKLFVSPFANSIQRWFYFEPNFIWLQYRVLRAYNNKFETVTSIFIQMICSGILKESLCITRSLKAGNTCENLQRFLQSASLFASFSFSPSENKYYCCYDAKYCIRVKAILYHLFV